MRAQGSYFERLDGELQVVDGAGRASEMKYVTEGSVDDDLLGDVVLDKSEPRGLDMGEVGAMTGDEVVHPDDFVTPLEQVVDEMGTYESGGTGDEDTLARQEEGSISVSMEEYPPKSQPQDLEIQSHRPVLAVVEVVLDALLDRGIAPPSVHLGPAGHSRLDLVTQHVLGNPFFEFLDETRSLRTGPDQPHGTLEHVIELRKLVDAEAAKNAAPGGSSRVLRIRPDRAGLLFRVLVHGAKFVDGERLSVQPHAFLRVEDRTPGGPLDERRDEREGNGYQGQQGSRQANIHAPLLYPVPALNGRLGQTDDRDPVQILYSRPRCDVGEVVPR